jgi:uncharacterized protein YegJ (DUF2314 family)
MQKSRHIMLAAAFLAVAASARAQSTGLSANAPMERAVGIRADCEWVLTQKAVAPFVAKARQSYPAARRKFLDRTRPARPMFVTMMLADAASHHEQIFVRVDSIVGTRVHGRIASAVQVVRSYAYGQRMIVEEKDLLDWMFANADGSEEGNFVGKFLDNYQPPRTCGET